jgi:hypothetical protein
MPRGSKFCLGEKNLNGFFFFFSFGFSSWQVLKKKKKIKNLKFVCLVLVASKNIDICLNILFSFFKKPDLAK